MKDYGTASASIETVSVATSSDVVSARQMVRSLAHSNGLSLIHQTKLVTAASELGRNMLVYGGGGVVRAAAVDDAGRCGIFVEFEDQGPGIADLELALTDGWTSGNGMGLGLSGAKRLVDEFDIESGPGGTTVRIVKWGR
ncbi:anti-sigma regulatory factor [Streptomyces sp. NPDC059688]|uniref:Anti-sigma regulatory factor n=2 Tax=Streptomyces TaxID=1883 RepID=A0ABY6EYZ0_9ACTN|nr:MULTISPECIES: anti-sigma regulatory factor [unclassified Streptomyces]OKJ78923.1 anti-sigma regulatory factor [Streptomyces sp. CB01883]ROP47660.1 serine/threonine-protein kinase RsbT [Streptomyces sp. PanSC9]UXY39630.1 anti-sigma regulatory factor [Streptomyces sp. HUAS 14-6]